MENWKVDRARELAEVIGGSDEWTLEALAELCDLAGLAAEWKEADGERFEAVACEAARRLGVEI